MNEDMIPKRFGVFDEEGFPKAFYHSDINLDIPEDAVEISHEDWLEMTGNPGRRKWADGSVIEYVPPVPTDEQKQALRDEQIKAAMTKEADPLFFKWQAGEIKKQVWLDKRNEIKARFN